MAKGSVRKKGKKWYYRFYVEDESGKQVQKELAGTESKSETEALLRKAMDDYDAKKFVAKSENITLGKLLDMWVEEELKPGSLSNGTVSAYQGTVGRIKQFPIGKRKLKGFIVTANNGEKTIVNKPVEVFKDVKSKLENSLIVIGVSNLYAGEIESYLKENSITNIFVFNGGIA